MVVNPLKVFLFLAGGTVAAGATAYVAGVLDPYLYDQTPAVADLPAPSPSEPVAAKGERLPGEETPPATMAAEPPADAAAPPPAMAAVVPPDDGAAIPPATMAAEPPAGPIAPSFDVVRVEGDGSVVIAGKATPDALVELLNGATVLAGAKAGAGGDFAIVLDEQLKPGDYQMTLRATQPGGAPTASLETAVLSIPKTPGGQVLAMIEQPGQASELLTVPQPEAPAAPKVDEAATPPAATPPADAAAAPKTEDAAATPQPPEVAAVTPPKAEEPAAALADAKVAVEAVEIEGSKIFVAGRSEPGRVVRAYANEIVLGETRASAAGRFLIEAERDLPVGNYLIRADVLDADGIKVIARAAVPFEREPGESVAAVAPPAEAAASAEPAAPQPEAPAAAATEPPSAEPAAPAAEPSPPAETPPAVAAAEPPAAGADVAAAPPPETTAPKLQKVQGAVVIRRGDSLWRISRRVYGRGIRYSTIYLANQQQIRDPDRIYPGQVFRMPDRTREGEAADMTAIGEQATTTTPE